MSADDCSSEDLDRVWRAVAGELPADERLDLIERLSSEPALAAAWRVAHALQSTTPEAMSVPATPVRGKAIWTRSWLAAAALLIFGVASAVVLQRYRPSGDDTFRTADHYVIEALIPAGAALPRDAFLLRWSPGPADTRYQVRVTTEDLRLLTTAELSQPEWTVPSDALSQVPSGARVVWQVDATFPDGEKVTSAAFMTRIQ